MANHIMLQVSDRRFDTTKETLTAHSPYFVSFFSGRFNSNRRGDGYWLIDADGDLFGDILNYCRRGLLPIFYDVEKGHDHVRYQRLLEEAKYFQIERLARWLEEKTYLKAVTCTYSVLEVPKASQGGPVMVRGHPQGTLALVGARGDAQLSDKNMALTEKIINIDHEMCIAGQYRDGYQKA